MAARVVACSCWASRRGLVLPWGRWGIFDEGIDVTGGIGFDAGFGEKAEVAEPVDEVVLPGAQGNVVAVGEASSQSTCVSQESLPLP